VQPTFRNTWPSWVALVLGFTCAAAFFASLGLLVLGVPVTNSPGFAALNPSSDKFSSIISGSIEAPLGFRLTRREHFVSRLHFGPRQRRTRQRRSAAESPAAGTRNTRPNGSRGAEIGTLATGWSASPSYRTRYNSSKHCGGSPTSRGIVSLPTFTGASYAAISSTPQLGAGR
jgi:hypothetical protein